jgi:hypothetical protein
MSGNLKRTNKLNLLPIALVLLIVASSLVGKSVEAKRVLRNLAAWNSWTQLTDRGGYVLSEDKEKSSGASCGKLESELPDQTGGSASIFLRFSPTLYTGKKVRYSGFIKTNKVNGSAGLWMMEQDGDKVVAFDDMNNRSASGTTDWKKYSIVLDIPKESQKLLVGFILRGGGTAWLRDPQFEIANPDEKSTAIPFDSSRFRLNVLPKGPRNLALVDPNSISENRTDDVYRWQAYTEHNYHIHVSPEVQDQGKPSVQVDCVGDTGNGFCSLHQTFSAQDYIGKRVCWSADLKNMNHTDWTTLFMQIDGEDRILAFDAMEDRQLKNLSDWTKASIVLDVPPESKKIKIGFLHAGKDKGWLSNCSFTTVDAQVPVTAKSGRMEKLPQEKMNLKPDFRFD